MRDIDGRLRWSGSSLLRAYFSEIEREEAAESQETGEQSRDVIKQKIHEGNFSSEIL